MGYQVNLTEDAREQQLAAVAERYVRGMSQWKIGQELGVTQQQVSYDLKIIRQRWLESSIRDFDEARAIEVAKIDDCEREFRAAWERSQRIKQVTNSKRKEGKDASTEAGVRKEEQVGDPRFMDGILKCIHMRCELLGLNAAKKISILDGDGNYGPFLTEDDRRNRLLAAFLEQGAAGGTGQAVM